MLILAACAGDTDSDSMNSIDAYGETGSLAFSVVVHRGDGARQASALSDYCDIIPTVRADLYKDNLLIQQGGPWACSDGGATLSEVPVGDGMVLTIQGLGADGLVSFEGTRENISVVKGQTAPPVTVDVYPVRNLAPVINPVDDFNGIAGYPVEIEVLAYDPNEEDDLTFSVDVDPDDIDYSFDPNPDTPNSYIFTWETVLRDFNTSHTLTFQVSDGNLSVSEEMTVNISDPDDNNPPYFWPSIGPREVYEGHVLSFPVTAVDEDNNIIEMSYSGTNLPPEDNIFFERVSPNSYTYQFSLETDYGDAGESYRIRFNVSDGPDSTYEWVRIDVLGDDEDPAVRITGPTTAASYTTDMNSVTLSGTVSDNVSAVSELTMTAGAAGNSYPVTRNTNGTWSTTISNLSEGETLVRVSATDESDNTGSDTVTIILDNTGPTVTITNPADNPFITRAGTLSLSGGVSDNDSVSSVQITIVPPSGASITDNCQLSFGSWSYDIASLGVGETIVTVFATDNAGNTGTGNTLRIIRDTEAPTVTINDPGADPTYVDAIVLTGTISDNVTAVGDLDLSAGSYQITNNNNGTWSAEINNLAEGSTMVTVSATDNAGNTGTRTVWITYENNSAPYFTEPADGASFAVYEGELISFNVAADDDDGDDIAVTRTGNNGGLTGSDGSYVFSWQTDYGDAGTYSIDFIVTDNINAPVTITVDIQILADTEAPTVNITEPNETEVDSITLSGTVSDTVSDPSALTMTATVSGVSYPVYIGTDGSWSSAEITDLSVGSTDVTVSAIDEAGNEGTDTSTIVYSEPAVEEPAVEETTTA